MKEILNSERLNYLIWRYLIEGNYRETALKFQKEWHVPEPHRQLDFARYVKSHALVNVVNKGLLYSSVERKWTQSKVPQNAAAEAEAVELGVFGPLDQDGPPHQYADEEDADADHEDDIPEQPEEPSPASGDIENTRKRSGDRPHQPQLNGGSPAKRPRLSNGYENGVNAATDPMELDNGTDNHAYPSPLEGEQAPTPTPRTDGTDQGTQVEKVQELTTETTFIPLGSGESISSPRATFKVSSANAPVLLHCQWNPQDPSILAAAGTDALARVWTVSRATTTLAEQDPAANGHVPNGDVSPPFHSLIEDDMTPSSVVTAMAWNGDGTVIAIATDSAEKGRISLWSADGTHIQHFEVPECPIIKLRWNPNNAAILAVVPEKGGTLITVYGAMTSNTISYSLPNHDLQSEPVDVAWTSETEFLLCGGGLMASLKCTEDKITETKRCDTREGDNLLQVQFDWRSSLAATCGEKGFVDIWDVSGKRREIKAHDGMISALTWQPLAGSPPEDERLLASGGVDGAIFVWNALSGDGKPKCQMTMDSPIVALAFTPDGAFIAGATNERILIWKVGDHSIPRASWSRSPHPGWLSPRINADSEDEDEHCLCWDATGQKLAYGVNHRLAVINFR
ncbi:hypothetical protein PG999_002663 [Apiospora kogelbergensis]|uniref:Uncharacterized protein n=1 Tax=Apiospora kogelbergensis TaxID=1337665 RepID=A0AAW0R908_9PEZI